MFEKIPQSYNEFKIKLELLGSTTFLQRHIVEFAMQDPNLRKKFAGATRFFCLYNCRLRASGGGR